MKTWQSGYNSFINNTITVTEQLVKYHCEMLDDESIASDNIVDILSEHVRSRQTRVVEVLYSGGIDSEFVLKALLQAKIPVRAVTLEMRVRGMLINAHDLYYATKFCRENNVEQKFVELDVEKFYNNGDHEAYLLPYHCTHPNVATQFYLLEQCSAFPVIGGDWPWLQTHVSPRVFSPFRLDFMAGDLFMQERGISGINNMLSHSLASCCKFISAHYEFAKTNDVGNLSNSFLGWGRLGEFKQQIYKNVGLSVEPCRLKAYGFEVLEIHFQWVDMVQLRQSLTNKVGEVEHSIQWHNLLAHAAETMPNTNNSFK